MNITVIVTSYNQKEFLKEAIGSVLSQILMPGQIVVVDDASTDGSVELIEEYSKQFPGLFSVILHQENQGISRSRIDGLKAVESDYVCFLDGDDRFLPAKLKKESEALSENKDAAIAYSNYYFISEDGNKRLYKWNDNGHIPQGNIFSEVFSRSFPRECLFRSELVNYNAWKATGFYDPGLSIYEDFDMKIRLTKELQAVYYNEPLSEYRINSSGLSGVDRNKHMESFVYIYNKNSELLSDLRKKDKKIIINGIRRRIIKFSMFKSRELLLNRNLSGLISHNIKSAGYLFSIS